ncbi:MAG TPA: hypothetical protein VNA28_05975 [Solirubrobacteraceae bacterium]|nr:hypothetical protein [Solirubrobacteraceae bacterium]
MPCCVDGGQSLVLDERMPAHHDSAFIGYGRDGFYFQSTGEYLVRAHDVGNDRTSVTSPALRLRVRAPATPVDERVGELLMGPER